MLHVCVFSLSISLYVLVLFAAAAAASSVCLCSRIRASKEEGELNECYGVCFLSSFLWPPESWLHRRVFILGIPILSIPIIIFFFFIIVVVVIIFFFSRLPDLQTSESAHPHAPW
jgi:hypothetical protein